MRIKITSSGARVSGIGKDIVRVGQIWDLPDAEAAALIAGATAVSADEPAVIETRDPEIEARDPVPARAKRTKKPSQKYGS